MVNHSKADTNGILVEVKQKCMVRARGHSDTLKSTYGSRTADGGTIRNSVAVLVTPTPASHDFDSDSRAIYELLNNDAVQSVNINTSGSVPTYMGTLIQVSIHRGISFLSFSSQLHFG